jgi:hypothetical protein
LPGLVSSPRRAAFIASIVSAFGTSGSNGSCFSWLSSSAPAQPHGRKPSRTFRQSEHRLPLRLVVASCNHVGRCRPRQGVNARHQRAHEALDVPAEARRGGWPVIGPRLDVRPPSVDGNAHTCPDSLDVSRAPADAAAEPPTFASRVDGWTCVEK